MVLDTRTHTGVIGYSHSVFNSWLGRYGYLDTRVHTWLVYALLSPLLLWSGNQSTLVESPGYTQCLQWLRDVSGYQDTHLDFLLGSTVVSTAWWRFLGTRAHTQPPSWIQLCSQPLVMSPWETSVHNPPLLLLVFSLVSEYSSLNLSWVIQSVTVMCTTLPDLCCCKLQRQDAQSVVLSVLGTLSPTPWLSSPMGYTAASYSSRIT